MVRVEGLRKRVDGFELGPIEFSVGQEVLVVLGENGAGKTTLLNLIAGILNPDSGRILLDGMLLNGVPVDKRKVGYILQKPYLFPHMNVLSNLMYGIDDRKSSERLNETITSLGISHLLDRRVQQLSGGEQQKVALGRTLITEPRVLLMDEPLVHLDVMSKKTLLHEFRDIFSRLHISVLYVSHDAREAIGIADRVLVLNRGRIFESGSVDSVLRNPQSEYVKALLGF